MEAATKQVVLITTELKIMNQNLLDAFEIKTDIQKNLCVILSLDLFMTLSKDDHNLRRGSYYPSS